MAEILRFDTSRLVHEAVEDAVLVIDIGAGCCFALDGGASALWPSLVTGNSREGLLRYAEAAFDAPAAVVRPAVDAFLTELLQQGVLVWGQGPLNHAVPPQRHAFEGPRVKRYDDLEELLRSED